MPFEISGAAKDLVASVEGSLFASAFKNPIYLSLGIIILLIIIIFVITFDSFCGDADVKIIMLKISIYGFLTILAAIFIHNKMIHHKYEVKALGGDSDMVFNRHNAMLGSNFHVAPNLTHMQQVQPQMNQVQPQVQGQVQSRYTKPDSFDVAAEKAFGASF